ncbi:hypothetical protein HNR26_004878 [Rhizobium rosettiformans]|jgi:hypothetical protein|uniref:Uncharacterized protein n=1 Tax=Rhizobium rosettiformans TaxID=1368430 RepID=A0A7W8HUY8_9HYPH|nr:hypothetical protein [Rhizobium rosettiformans]
MFPRMSPPLPNNAHMETARDVRTIRELCRWLQTVAADPLVEYELRDICQTLAADLKPLLNTSLLDAGISHRIWRLFRLFAVAAAYDAAANVYSQERDETYLVRLQTFNMCPTKSSYAPLLQCRPSAPRRLSGQGPPSSPASLRHFFFGRLAGLVAVAPGSLPGNRSSWPSLLVSTQN